MPFTLPKDSNKVIVKKPIDNTSTTVIKSKESVGVDSTSIIVNSLKLNGTIVTSDTINKLEYTNSVTPGTAQAGKVLIVDANKSITGLNTIKCNGLLLKGSQIDPMLFVEGAESGDLTDKYISNVYRGTAAPDKALISDYDYSIQNINNLGVKTLKLNKKDVFISGNIGIDTSVDYSEIFTGLWKYIKDDNNVYSSLAYSEINDIYVMVGTDISTSKDGLKWIPQAVTRTYNSVCWSKSLNLFIAVNNNTVIRSNNGTTWTSVSVTDKDWKSVTWSNELGLFICVGTNASMYSSDGISWTVNTTTTSMKLVKWIPRHHIFIGISDTSIFTSTNGIYWSTLLTLTNTYLTDIVFSNELSRVLISSVYENKSYILYSDDSQTWKFSNDYPTYNWRCLAWSSYLEIFVGLDNGVNGYYSKDGISWKTFIYCDDESANICSIAWSENYGKFIGIGNGILNSKIVGIAAKGRSSNINKVTITNNGKMGLGVQSPSSMLEIAEPSGKCLKLINGDNYTSFDVSNKNLRIRPSSTFNIQTNYKSYGLMLNDELVKAKVHDLNTYLSGITPGTVTASSVVTANYGRNISGISSINVDSLIVSASSKNTNTNHIAFRDVTVGNAKATKALVLDSTKSIIGISNYKTSKLLVGNTSIKLNDNTNLNVINSVNYNNNLSETNIADDHVDENNHLLWITELSMFVLINNSGLSNSKDGLTWNKLCNKRWNGIAWSTKLYRLTIAGEAGIATCTNGSDWKMSNVSDNCNSVHWSNELELFLATSTNKIFISIDGYNWTSIDITYTFTNILWVDKLELYVATTNDIDNKTVYLSKDCLSWESANSYYTNIEKYDLSWSSNLELLMLSTSDKLLYSTNGYNWTQTSISTKHISWLPDIRAYLTSDNDNIYISIDGMCWNVVAAITSTNKSNVVYSGKYGCICLFDENGFIRSKYNNSYDIHTSCLYTHPEHIRVDYSNKRIGLGVNPQYALHLSTDRAGALSSTWTVASDERLKKNIQDANLDTCSYNIKKLRLVEYDWKNEIKADDKNKLGWIAQDVEEFIPNAVTKVEDFGYLDCRKLDTDQIIANMYGAIQNLITISEINENIYNRADDKLTFIDDTIDKLEEYK